MKTFWIENSVSTMSINMAIKETVNNKSWLVDFDIRTPYEALCIPPDNCFLQMSADEAKNLINGLWIAGVRPSQDIMEPTNHSVLKEEVKWLRTLADRMLEKIK